MDSLSINPQHFRILAYRNRTRGRKRRQGFTLLSFINQYKTFAIFFSLSIHPSEK
ncbi:hypothetical protein JCM21738_5308 [Mesobacillus boroniphilus JCM 21738]|uniref:Uncharacterized protein n=1 Tax=Mesobacillus boroniphilus JCM 21738 TaxID=1294265 RepID=W4RV89_9BACI|nr:hypothetical protein JCM21738_5308 [Mesobacillus boroniphilus JCM 21738]